MKGTHLFAAAVIGAFLLGFSAVSQAGGWMHRSGGTGEGDMKAMERAQKPAVSDTSSWQYFEAVETGNFPSHGEAGSTEARNIPPVLWDQPQGTTRLGWQEFRSVDIGP